MKKPHATFLHLGLSLLAAGQLGAAPYAPRAVTIGMDAATVSGTGGLKLTPQPVAAAFEVGATLQWYAGGSLMTKAPFPGSVQLPAITLPQTPTATVRPLAGTACDLDGDGDVDVVRINEWVGNAFLYTLQVFVNNGNGTFTLGERIDTPNAPGWNEGQHFFEIVAADFDRDGKPDLAILETYNNTNTAPNPDREEGRLIIRWQEGSTQFDTVTIVKSTGLDADSRLSVADCDRDGDNDIVCSDDITWEPDAAQFHFKIADTVLLRNGGGRTFTQESLNGRPATFVDLNRDGWPDLADSEAVALNNGGTFDAPVTEVATAATAYAFADPNADGKTDLVRSEGSNLVFHAGNGAGGFTATGLVLATLGGPALAISVADSDADGDEDFFVTLSGGGFVWVENAGFHFAPGVAYGGRQSLAGVTQLFAGDFFRDGIQDVVALTPTQKKLWLLDGGAHGGFAFAAPVFKLTGGEEPHSAAVADFNADGLPDLAYTLPAAGEVRVVQNAADTIPFGWPDAAAATGVSGVAQLVSGYRGAYDGYPDLLSSSATTGQLRWHHQRGDGWSTQAVLDPISPAPGAILAAHGSNAPGDELFVQTADATQTSVRAYQALFGYGSLGTDRTEGVQGGPHVTKMLRLDVDGDGSDDTVYVSGSGQLSAWDPTTASAHGLPTVPDAIRDIAAVDWNRDGRTDILCATSGDLYLLHYDARNYGWVQVPLWRGGPGYRAVVCADFTGDGWPDAVAATDTELLYFRNAPKPGDAVQVGGDRNLTVGTSGAAVAWTMVNKGRATSATHTAEPNAVCTGAFVQFLRAQLISGSWVEGSPLTASELSSVVSSVRLVAGPNRTVIGATAPAALNAQGFLEIEYHPILGNLVPIPAGVNVTHEIQLEVRPDALASGISRIFVRGANFSGVPQNGLVPIEPGEGANFQLIGEGAKMVTFLSTDTPLQAWRRTHWNSPAASGPGANDADPDADGVPNLVEYVCGTDPTAAEPAVNAARGLFLQPLPTSQSPVQVRVVLNSAALADPGVEVTILSNTSLGAWSIFSRRTGGDSWYAGPTPTSTTEAGGLTSYLFATGHTRATLPQWFVALRVEEVP